MTVISRTVWIGLVVLTASVACAEEFRFPMPEFSTGYTYPDEDYQKPEERPVWLDITVLALSLTVAAWLVLKHRSRRALFLLTVFCLLYFGFWRRGCVCSVGSVQNVTESFTNPEAVLSIVTVMFFLLPLVFALFFGRVFCAAVCPLGAIQEAVAIRPTRLPRPLARMLELIPPIYLGLTILSVATGAGYLICRYDPFVGFFRFGAGFNMLIAGGVLLLIGVFVFRPYCRFLCPYGVLLNWLSRFSKWHATITPAECIQCRLCEDSCPFDAINIATPERGSETRKKGTRRLTLLLIVSPLILIIGAATGYGARNVLARLHPTVRLAERVIAEDAGLYKEQTLESETFRANRETTPELIEKAEAIRADFTLGSILLGLFVAAIVVGKIIRLGMVRVHADYEPDKGHCVSCGRCFAYCPVLKNE